jgi:hypothetical protein
MMRWAKSGVLDQVFKAMHARQIIQIKMEAGVSEFLCERREETFPR